MKNLIWLLFFSFSACQAQGQTHFNKEIAKKINGDISITANLETIKSDWELHLSFAIGKVEITEISEEYFLLATSSEDCCKAIIALVLDGDIFYEASNGGNGGSVECSCTAPPGTNVVGCDPKKLGGQWTCTACTGTCTKTSKNISGGVIKSI